MRARSSRWALPWIATLTLAAACGSPTDAPAGDVASNDATTDAASADGLDATDATATSDATDAADAADTTAITPDAPAEPPLKTKSFALSTAPMLNPERGWMEGDGLPLHASDSYLDLRARGYTMAFARVMLERYRTSAIDAAFLDDLAGGFARVKEAKVKVVLRFVYNDPPATIDDASESQILAHLAPVVAAHAGVVAVWQAGFIGQWGEWHDSTNGLDAPAPRKRIIDAIVAALPDGRATQVRTPAYKAEWFPSPLTKTTASAGGAQTRIGHHNDCLLASDDDYGTYPAPIDTWKSYVADDTRFVPLGGETCALNPPRSSCPSALAELARLHWSFLNDRYRPEVIDSWKKGACLDEIGARLGYRLSFVDASFSERVRPGGVLALHLHVKNDGWASLYNPRPVEVLLAPSGPGAVSAAVIKVDPRSWAEGTTSAIDVALRIPAALAPGAYRVMLRLPDAATELEAVPEYSVRFANDGAWDATLGANVVTDALMIDPAAPGAIDAASKTFEQL